MFVLTYLAKGKAVPLNCLLWLWKLSKQSQRETSLSSGTVRRYKDWRTEIFNRTHLHRDSEPNCKFLTTWGSLVLICWTHLILMANESLVQPQTVRWVKSYSGGMLEEEWSEEKSLGKAQVQCLRKKRLCSASKVTLKGPRATWMECSWNAGWWNGGTAGTARQAAHPAGRKPRQKGGSDCTKWALRWPTKEQTSPEQSIKPCVFFQGQDKLWFFPGKCLRVILLLKKNKTQKERK